MSETSESGLIQEFREAIARDEIPADARLVFQVTGGMPSLRREEKFEILAGGKVNFTMCAISHGGSGKAGTAELPPSECRRLFRLLSRGLDSLLSRSQARFLPDSAVGSITVQVGERKETRYFLVNEIDRRVQRRPIAAEILEAIEQIRALPDRSNQEGQGNERYQS